VTPSMTHSTMLGEETYEASNLQQVTKLRRIVLNAKYKQKRQQQKEVLCFPSIGISDYTN